MRNARIDLNALREQWISEAADGDIGLWAIANDVREALGDGAEEEMVCKTTVEALRPLLASGNLRAADMFDGNGRVYPEGVDEQLAHIETAWKEVGKPDIGDVAWFSGPCERAAIELPETK